MQLVFLLEEKSMETFLSDCLSKIVPETERHELLFVSHNGKTDLLKSIPIKMKAWRHPDARFVVLADQDRDDCRTLKDKITAACGARRFVLVRIVCSELENWYLGNLPALDRAFPSMKKYFDKRVRQYRNNLDDIVAPSRGMVEYAKCGGKIKLAREVARRMREDPDPVGANRSASFLAFVTGLRKLIEAPPAASACADA